MPSNVVTCTKGVDGKLYYFRNGKRVKASEVTKPPSKCTKSKAVKVGGKTCPQGYTKGELVALSVKAKIFDKETAEKYSKEELCSLLAKAAKAAKKSKAPLKKESKKGKATKKGVRFEGSSPIGGRPSGRPSTPYLGKLAVPKERKSATPVKPSPKQTPTKVFLWKARTGSALVDFQPMPLEFIELVDLADLREEVASLGALGDKEMYVYVKSREANYLAEKATQVKSDAQAIDFAEHSYPRLAREMVMLSSSGTPVRRATPKTPPPKATNIFQLFSGTGPGSPEEYPDVMMV